MSALATLAPAEGDLAPPPAPADDEPTDRVLLAASGSAARWAFTRVLRRHSRALHAVALKRLGSASDAEEVVQDAFVLLWRKRATLHLAGDSALPWLLVTVQHLVQNRRRALARRGAHELVGIEQDPAAAPAPERDDAVEAAFAVLGPVDEAVARLCLADGLTYRQAADRLGLTEGAVRNRLSRARTRLRRSLDDRGPS